MALNITGATSDAELYRFAVATADSDKEILRTLNSLQKIRNEARKAKAEVAGAKKGFLKGTKGGLEFQGIGTLGGNGFTLSGRYMRGASGLMLVLGAAQAAENIVEQFDKWKAQEAELGRGEVLGRTGGAVIESAFRFATGGEGGRAIARLIGRVLFDKTAAQSNDAFEEFQRRITTTSLQKAERQFQLRAAQANVERAQSEFIESEIQFLETWRPQNVQLRSSADVAALKKAVWERNEGSLLRDITENRKALQARAKTEVGKD